MIIFLAKFKSESPSEIADEFRKLFLNSNICSDELIINEVIHIAYYFYFENKKFIFGAEVFLALFTNQDTRFRCVTSYASRLLYYGGELYRLNQLFNDLNLNEKFSILSIKETFNLNNELVITDFWTYSIGHTALLYYRLCYLNLNGSLPIKIKLRYDRSRAGNTAIIDSLIHRFNIYEERHNSDVIFNRAVQEPESLLYSYKGGRLLLTDFLFYVSRDFKNHYNLLTKLSLPINVRRSSLKILSILTAGKMEWFVTLHIRNRKDGSRRNTPLNLVVPAIEEVLRNGGYVMRIGESEEKLLISHPHYVDVPSTIYNTHELNAYLLSECLFSIQNSSGPGAIPHLFGRPSLQLDIFPPHLSIPSHNDLLLPRRIYAANGKLLPLKSLNSGRFYSETLIDESLYTGVSPSQEDIRQGVIEMFARLNDEKKFNEINDLENVRNQMNKIFFTDSNLGPVPIISPAYLKRYPELLAPD